MDILKGLHKQHHRSPKAWRELKYLADVFNQKVWRMTNLGGTRWLQHMERALRVLLKNYPVLLSQMENSVVIHSCFLIIIYQSWSTLILICFLLFFKSNRSSSAEMIGPAKQCLQVLKAVV